MHCVREKSNRDVNINKWAILLAEQWQTDMNADSGDLVCELSEGKKDLR